MTSLEVLSALQEYYGIPYTKAQARYIKEWLDTKSDAWREALLSVTLLRYKGVTSRGDRYLPNIAILDELAPEVRKVLADKNGR
ncbi:MAG: hypothetical protein C0436_00220 [Alphaproteobacteria bacterium]|nr:hypothetical protein [Alphaproteobacteria bacterium]